MRKTNDKKPVQYLLEALVCTQIIKWSFCGTRCLVDIIKVIMWLIRRFNKWLKRGKVSQHRWPPMTPLKIHLHTALLTGHPFPPLNVVLRVKEVWNECEKKMKTNHSGCSGEREMPISTCPAPFNPQARFSSFHSAHFAHCFFLIPESECQRLG